MVQWPENGTIGYSAKEREFVTTEHNTDGTHNLSTIGWTETAVITKDMTDASGATSVVSSLSFQPRLVIFFASLAGKAGASWGADDGTVARSIVQVENGNMASVTESVHINDTLIASIGASITALSSTGFTITWNKNGSPTGTATIIALCFK